MANIANSNPRSTGQHLESKAKNQADDLSLVTELSNEEQLSINGGYALPTSRHLVPAITAINDAVGGSRR